ncbi:uncharacterized protein LOC141674130 [Apium graveolens]|uniref:uncharacterized protein LOC141674130 n=1 Tax=Apium graveolens TaxID=4045 RepID=UPI003D7A63A6
MVSCPFAVSCWNKSFPGSQSIHTQVLEVWLEKMFGKYSDNKYADIVTLCWALWRARNDVVWEKKYSRVNRVIASAKQYLLRWKCAPVTCSSVLFRFVVEEDGAITWVRPTRNSIKVTVDATLFAERREYGLGIVARDADGLLVEAKIKCYSGTVTVEYVEALGIKEALSWIKNKGWQEVKLESDCLAVVQAIRCTVEMQSSFGQVVADCRRELRDSNSISLLFIKRSANVVTHCFARASHRYPDRTFDWSDIPIEFQDCIQMESI